MIFDHSVGNRSEFGLSRQSSLSACLGGVAALNFFASPSAISWFIISVIVDAVERRFWWADAHVGKKIIEYFPPFTKGNAASSVVLPAVGFGVSAALFHGCPRLIGSRISALPRMGVSELRRVISLYAATTARFSFDCARSWNCYFRTTIATKDPASMLALDVREAECNQATETGSSMISAGRHV
jgi:hypothetical protein